MKQDWQTLTKMTQGEEIVVSRIRVTGSNISIEGDFELPPLAKLSSEDQIFVAAFIKTHGSIKEMEKLFGISYPTVKGRLNKIAEKFDFLKIASPVPKGESPLDLLSKGEISVEEALKEIRG